MSAAAAPERGWKSEKVDEAQALARSCAARRPDFQPCDGLSICATHSHGKCFKLHWCCHLGWCHCKYVYQPMTPVEQLPSTEIPAQPREPTNTIQISVSLTEHFLKFASVFQPPLPPDSPRYCMISDLFIDNYQVKCINGKMCYVQKQPAPHSHKTSPEEVSAHDALISKESNTPKIDHCSSPSSSEDSGINAIGAHYVESCDEDTEEGAELSSEEDYSPESSWEPDECTLLSPSQSDLERRREPELRRPVAFRLFN
uniref:Chromosome 19 C3orf70 homolog n=1 Tax=Equus caballus TaxID=9796 RepID=F6UC11_HORSE